MEPTTITTIFMILFATGVTSWAHLLLVQRLATGGPTVT